MIRKKFKFMGSDEESPAGDFLSNLTTSKSEQQRDTCSDEDLFSRAAEIKRSALFLAGEKEGFAFETNEACTMSEVITDETRTDQ